MKIKAQMRFAEILNVSSIRVQDVRLDYDNSNVYISATLLDRTPAAGLSLSLSLSLYSIACH